MKNLKLSQQYAVVALNGLESLHPSKAKNATLRAVAAAKVMEEALAGEEYDALMFLAKLDEAAKRAKALRKKEIKALETEMFALLETDGLMELVPDILGCDMYYYTSGIELKAYRSEEKAYLSLREGLRAEILEDGEISLESAILLWLHRESGCIHDLFSVDEQNRVQSRMMELSVSSDIYRSLWETEFRNALEFFTGNFLRAKNNMFKNPYLEGVNILFPFLERRQAIFVDCVIFGTTVKERRIAVMEHISNMGHYVEEVQNGSETLLRIDQAYYRLFPKTTRVSKVPIQGVALVPMYW